MMPSTERTRLQPEAVRALVQDPGPWASVYVGLADRDPQGRPVERAVRWHSLARTLLDGGAPADVVAAIGAAVQAEPPGAAVLAAFAHESHALSLFRVPFLDEPDTAGVGPLPRVLPLLGWLQDHPSHVVVVTDRTGADLEAVAVGGRSRRWSVAGPDDEIERNAPGGWAQGRYQHRAEDSWAHNAAAVAEAVATAVRDSDTRLVIAAGDVRAVQLLEENLPDGLRKQIAWRQVAGGRSPDGSQRTRPERVEEAVREFVDGEVGALLGRFAQERAPGGVGVEGVPETFASLARGEVAALLLVPDAMGGRSAWFGPHPTRVLPDDRALPPADWGPAMRASLADVAVRAALGTRGQVWLVPDGLPGSPAEGIGAICRFR
jgi:hypothetical protein